jgi:SAM-dependent methyltransferase
METHDAIAQNRATWNAVCDLFFEASALPQWGPFGIGDDLGLLPEIQDRTFLEIACGSGRSLAYLLGKGAKKVYGLDVSDGQVAEALRFNAEAVAEGRVEIFQGAMEERIDIEPVDMVVSVYGFGWTQDPARALAHVFSYLKPGGSFIWSWDHSFFRDVEYADGGYRVRHAYHDETPIEKRNWKREGCVARITYRKTETWFRLIREAGFDIVGYHEPAPKTMERGETDPARYYAVEKARLVPASFIFVCRKPGGA